MLKALSAFVLLSTFTINSCRSIISSVTATQEKTKQATTTKTYFKKLNADVIKLTSQDTDHFAGAIENNNDQERELQQVSSFETIDDDDDDIDIDFCAGCKNYIGNCAICQDLKDTGNIIDTGNSSDTNDTLYNDTEVEVNCEECEEFVDECAVCGEYPDDGYDYTYCNAAEPYLIGNGECNYEYFFAFGCYCDGGDCGIMDLSPMDLLPYLWDEYESGELDQNPGMVLIYLFIFLSGLIILIPVLTTLLLFLPLIPLIILTNVLTLVVNALQLLINVMSLTYLGLPCAMVLMIILVSSNLFPIFSQDQDLQNLKDILNQTMNMKDLMIQNKTIFF